MEAIKIYLSEVFLLGTFAPADLLVPLAFLVLAVDVTLTFVHGNQERKGHLWRYFGAIAGTHIPDAIGFAVFFVILTIFLWAVAVVGFTGGIPLVGISSVSLGVGSVAFLIAGRLSDRFYSHVRLDREGYRPNPGLPSVRFYLIEAVVLIVLFLPGLVAHYLAAGAGFFLGWLLFYAVLPLLRFAHSIFPGLQRESWPMGRPAPAWAEVSA